MKNLVERYKQAIMIAFYHLHQHPEISWEEFLRSMEKLPKGTIRFIFQPAEEKGNGALRLVEEGVVDDVDYLYGVHLRPYQEMPLGKAAPGIVHGAARHISGKIIGEDMLGARPHLGANAIEIGAAFVHLLQRFGAFRWNLYFSKRDSSNIRERE